MCDEDAERLRAERNAKRRAHYWANREKVLARNKAHKAADPEKQRTYRLANREKERARAKAYRTANREKTLAHAAAYREANKEQRKASQKAYHAANREKRRAYMAARRPPCRQEAAPMSGAPLSHLLPPLPGFTALARTYAPWPVWSGSTTQPVRFAPLAKKAAVRLWHRARDFDRGTHQPGHHGGALGHTGLAVLHALIFDFAEPHHRPARSVATRRSRPRPASACARSPRRYSG